MGFRCPWVGYEGFVVGVGSSGGDCAVPTGIKGLLNGIGSSGWDFGVLAWDLRVLWLGLGLLDGISGSQLGFRGS